MAPREAESVEVTNPVPALVVAPTFSTVDLVPEAGLDPDPDPVLLGPLLPPSSSALYRYPPIPVAVGASMMVLLPITRIELLVPRLIGMPPLAVVAGAPGVRVMLLSTMMTRASEMRIGIFLEEVDIVDRTEVGVAGLPGEGPLVRVIVRAVEAPVLLIMRARGAAPEGEGTLGKVIVCAIEAPALLMIRTGGAAPGCVGGSAGERETIVPPGRVCAAEPGRIVTGEPVSGV